MFTRADSASAGTVIPLAAHGEQRCRCRHRLLRMVHAVVRSIISIHGTDRPPAPLTPMKAGGKVSRRHTSTRTPTVRKFSIKRLYTWSNPCPLRLTRVGRRLLMPYCVRRDGPKRRRPPRFRHRPRPRYRQRHRPRHRHRQHQQRRPLCLTLPLEAQLGPGCYFRAQTRARAHTQIPAISYRATGQVHPPLRKARSQGKSTGAAAAYRHAPQGGLLERFHLCLLRARLRISPSIGSCKRYETKRADFGRRIIYA